MPDPVSTPSPSSQAPPTAPTDAPNPSADIVWDTDSLGIDFNSDVDSDTPPVAEPPKVEPPKDDQKPASDDVPPEPVDDKPPEKPDIDPAPPAVEFDEDDKPFLKKMSKEASAHFGKKIVSLKEQVGELTQAKTELESKLEAADGKKLPDSWHDHEEAYVLSPEFKEVSQKFAAEQKTTAFWHKQLLACKYNTTSPEGSDFVPYYTMGEDGKPVQVTPATHSADHEVTIGDLRMEHYRNQEKLAEQSNKIAADFGKIHKEAATQVEAAINDKRPWIKDTKNPLNKTYTQILEKVPKPYRNHPMAKAFAASTVHVLMLQAKIQEAAKKAEVKKSVADDQKEAGPIPGKHGKSSSKGDDVVYKPEDMTGM